MEAVIDKAVMEDHTENDDIMEEGLSNMSEQSGMYSINHLSKENSYFLFWLSQSRYITIFMRSFKHSSKITFPCFRLCARKSIC